MKEYVGPIAPVSYPPDECVHGVSLKVRSVPDPANTTLFVPPFTPVIQLKKGASQSNRPPSGIAVCAHCISKAPADKIAFDDTHKDVCLSGVSIEGVSQSTAGEGVDSDYVTGFPVKITGPAIVAYPFDELHYDDQALKDYAETNFYGLPVYVYPSVPADFSVRGDPDGFVRMKMGTCPTYKVGEDTFPGYKLGVLINRPIEPSTASVEAHITVYLDPFSDSLQGGLFSATGINNRSFPGYDKFNNKLITECERLAKQYARTHGQMALTLEMIAGSASCIEEVSYQMCGGELVFLPPGNKYEHLWTQIVIGQTHALLGAMYHQIHAQKTPEELQSAFTEHAKEIQGFITPDEDAYKAHVVKCLEAFARNLKPLPIQKEKKPKKAALPSSDDDEDDEENDDLTVAHKRIALCRDTLPDKYSETLETKVLRKLELIQQTYEPAMEAGKQAPTKERRGGAMGAGKQPPTGPRRGGMGDVAQSRERKRKSEAMNSTSHLPLLQSCIEAVQTTVHPESDAPIFAAWLGSDRAAPVGDLTGIDVGLHFGADSAVNIPPLKKGRACTPAQALMCEVPKSGAGSLKFSDSKAEKKRNALHLLSKFRSGDERAQAALQETPHYSNVGSTYLCWGDDNSKQVIRSMTAPHVSSVAVYSGKGKRPKHLSNQHVMLHDDPIVHNAIVRELKSVCSDAHAEGWGCNGIFDKDQKAKTAEITTRLNGVLQPLM